MPFDLQIPAPTSAPVQTSQTIGEFLASGGPIMYVIGAFSIVAGPCAVETPERLFEIAESVRAVGGGLLRGGAYKPRTSPYSFQGLGDRGLQLLSRVKQETGLGIVTEVLDPRDVERVAGVADMLQLGSRSMANAALLREAGASGLPILRGWCDRGGAGS